MLPYKYSVEVDDTEYKVYSIMTKKWARFWIKWIWQFEIEGKWERWAWRITEDIARAEIKKQLKENKRKETEPEIYYSGAPERFHSHGVNRTWQRILRLLMTKKIKGHYHGTDPISWKEFTSKTYYSNIVTGWLSSIRGQREIRSKIRKFHESQMDAK
jgi:hypothetical protein